MDLAVPVAEKDPSQVAVAAAATALDWRPGVDQTWTSPQLFDPQSRHR